MDLKILEQNISELLIKKCGTVKAGLIKAGVGLNTIYNIKKQGQMPSIEKVAKIAETFGVSVDYLLGRETNGISLTVDQEILLAFYNECPYDAQTAILKFAEYQADTSRQQNDAADNEQDHSTSLL